jgi:hypothetical protein
MPIFPRVDQSARPLPLRLPNLHQGFDDHPYAPRRHMGLGGATIPQPVPGSTPPPPPPEVPPSETPPEVNDPAVPHEHEPIRDPQPFQPGALH